MWIRASYIASKENVEADAASRNKNFDTEWELSNRYFDQIANNFGMPSVDLFTTRTNKKCTIFYSRYPDPEAAAVDAFTVSWKNKKFYAFPPFALILRTFKTKKDHYRSSNRGGCGALLANTTLVSPIQFASYFKITNI